MQAIPQPHLLDPDRLLNNDRDDLLNDSESKVQQLDKAFRETCGYAGQLWQTLDDVRTYLMASLPPDPTSSEGLHSANGAHPTGPDDEQGWRDWAAAFAEVSSVLCGPHGDSGYGRKEADRAARVRRDAPIVRLREHHPQLQRPEADARVQPAADAAATTSAGSAPHAATQSATAGLGKTAALVVLAALAVRGLLPRRGARSSVS